MPHERINLTKKTRPGDRRNFVEPQKSVEKKFRMASVIEGRRRCVTAKRKDRRKAEENTRKETRKEGEHLD